MQSPLLIDYPGADSFMLLLDKTKSYFVLNLQQAWCYFFQTMLRGLCGFFVSQNEGKIISEA